jgi:hypothetical protein
VKAIDVPLTGGTSATRGGATPHRFAGTDHLSDSRTAAVLGPVLASVEDGVLNGTGDFASNETLSSQDVVTTHLHQRAPASPPIELAGGVSHSSESRHRAKDLLFSELGEIDDDSTLFDAIVLLDADHLLLLIPAR